MAGVYEFFGDVVDSDDGNVALGAHGDLAGVVGSAHGEPLSVVRRPRKSGGHHSAVWNLLA
jgi:hypothetical protein